MYEKDFQDYFYGFERDGGFNETGLFDYFSNLFSSILFLYSLPTQPNQHRSLPHNIYVQNTHNT